MSGDRAAADGDEGPVPEPSASELIGQAFTDPRHFWSRPSATAPMPYNAANSGGSNLGPTSKALADRVKDDVEKLKAENPAGAQAIIAPRHLAMGEQREQATGNGEVLERFDHLGVIEQVVVEEQDGQ